MVESSELSSHLRRLEDEAVFVFREVAAELSRPVLLFSAGKDSSVLLHLARKAFFPSRLPFPLLHVASGWDFQDLLAFRDRTVAELELDLIVHSNEEAARAGINPFDTAMGEYARLMLTEALKSALDLHRFDAAIGGGRRDEERARAKERIFSHRGPGHSWEPRRQRPELWRQFNTRLAPGETMRVFPLSNWTELDIWSYIQAEGIEVTPLYFARERQVVERNGALLVADDDRMRFAAGEVAHSRLVRFRTLGCWPLSAAIASDAADIVAVLAELRVSHASEREGRLIDGATQASMERKKSEGYF